MMKHLEGATRTGRSGGTGAGKDATAAAVDCGADPIGSLVQMFVTGGQSGRVVKAKTKKKPKDE